MPKPRKSTLDAWLDQFAEWNAEDRAFALGQLQAIHRGISVAERRAAKPEDIGPAPEMPQRRQDELDQLMRRQQSAADASDPQRNAALLIDEGPKQ